MMALIMAYFQISFHTLLLSTSWKWPQQSANYVESSQWQQQQSRAAQQHQIANLQIGMGAAATAAAAGLALDRTPEWVCTATISSSRCLWLCLERLHSVPLLLFHHALLLFLYPSLYLYLSLPLCLSSLSARNLVGNWLMLDIFSSKVASIKLNFICHNYSRVFCYTNLL